MGSDHFPLDIRSKNLFKRCIQCEPLTSASCPACASDEVCTLTPATCDHCAQYECIAASDSGAVAHSAATSEKSVGPVIAGAVIGGVILIAVGVFLLWKYALKGKRRESVPVWESVQFPLEKSGLNSPRSERSERSTLSHDAQSRMSAHTVNSMASTVLTRASNVIQIAFIPGVTARQDGEPGQSPRTLVPPVPPVPLPTSPLSRNMSSTNTDDIHFHPVDLRGSTYSGISTIDGRSRRSIAPSVAPSLARASISSTIYAGAAVGVIPSKPSIVSVRSNNSATSSPHTSTPPVPPVELRNYSPALAPQRMVVQMPVSRERGDANAVPPGRAASVRMKPKAVLISKPKNNATDSAASSPALVQTPTLTSLTEEGGVTPLTSSPLATNPRIQSIASDATHSRDQNVNGPEDVDDDASPHERSRQSLGRKGSGPFSDSAAIASDPNNPLVFNFVDRTDSDSPFADSNAL